jgi:hypothetical protein
MSKRRPYLKPSKGKHLGATCFLGDQLVKNTFPTKPGESEELGSREEEPSESLNISKVWEGRTIWGASDTGVYAHM